MKRKKKSTWKREKDRKGYFNLFRPLSSVKSREHKSVVEANG